MSQSPVPIRSSFLLLFLSSSSSPSLARNQAKIERPHSVVEFIVQRSFALAHARIRLLPNCKLFPGLIPGAGEAAIGDRMIRKKGVRTAHRFQRFFMRGTIEDWEDGRSIVRRASRRYTSLWV